MPQDPNIVERIKSPYQVVHVANDQGEIINALGGGGSSGGSGGATPAQIQAAIESAVNLANILAKLEQIRTNAATETTLASALTALNMIATNTASNRYDFQLAEDAAGTAFVIKCDYQAGSLVYLTLGLAPYTPIPPITVAPPDTGSGGSSAASATIVSQVFEATTNSAGNWEIGQALRRIQIISPIGVVTATAWHNDATATAISTAPTPTDYKLLDDVSLDELRNIQAIIGNLIGAIDDAAWISGDGTVITLLKAIATSVKQTTSPITNGIITIGGTAQSLAAADPEARFAEFQNTSSGDLWINEGADAGINAGFKLLPGSSWCSPPHHKPTGSFSVYGATTGQRFVFRRG
jgi:hypothetical protein